MNDSLLGASTVKPRTRSTPCGGFQWTCPFCGTSRLNAAADESGRENALVALRTHIVASDGADHGPRHDYPPEFDHGRLPDHVVQRD